MARRTPAVDRTVAVLNHLAAHPDDRYTLSELARDLDLNKATAHALLATLADTGYLVRDVDTKTYSLGPALIAVGNAATATYPAATLAQEPMRKLAKQVGLEVVASQAIGDEIVILASAGHRRPLGISIRPGLRLPLVPPLGTAFIAWAGEERIERWLDTLGPDAEEAERERYRSALETVRERRFSVGLGGDEQQRLVESLREENPLRKPTAPGEEYALVELAESRSYRINHIGAPVFDSRGNVVLSLFLIGFRGEIMASEVPEYARRLVEACDEITASMRGRIPVLT